MSNQKEMKKISKFLKDLLSTIEEIKIYLSPENDLYKITSSTLKEKNYINIIKQNSEKIISILNEQFLIKEDFSENDIKNLRKFIFTEITFYLEIFNSFFNQIIISLNKNSDYQKRNLDPDNPLTLFTASYFLLNLNYKNLKNIINRYFDLGFVEHEKLEIRKEDDPIWNTENMKYKEFQSDIRKINFYTNEILNDVDDQDLKNDFLLSLQISEFIKNAIKHGNKCKIEKKVRVWYNINSDFAKIIIEDEGEGFKNLEEWNKFNELRNKYIKEQDFENILKYAAYHSEHSSPEDGGNFLFSALQYWDSGVIFNPKRNKIVVIKYFY